MKKENQKRLSALRKIAEKRLNSENMPIEKLSEADVRKLAHELQVHQVELEMQNEELRKAQEELHDSRDKYSSLYSFAPVGYFTISDKGVILEANLTGAEMIGIERSGLIGKPLGLFITKEYEDVFYLQRKEVCKVEGKRGIREIVMKRVDGTQFYAQLQCNAALDAGGNSTGCLTVISDITERKKAELELAEYRHHLETLVEERTRELKDSQAQTIRKEKLATVFQMASSLSNELRNPLTIMGNSAYFLKEKMGVTDDMVRKHLDFIHDEVFKSDKIISSILDLTRARSLSLIKADVNKIVQYALSEFKIAETIHIKTQLGEKLPIIELDHKRILSIFKNLIANSLQAMPEGGSLEIKTDVKGGFICIEFRDTGVGISEENIQKIFDPLFTTGEKGIGLGLAIAKEIIDEHKGSISVESEIEKGTISKIKLPIT